MDLLKKAAKIVKAAVGAAITPESFDKGQEFEEYIHKYLFPKSKFDLVHHSHDFSANRDSYVETSLYPDFKFRAKETGKEFWVEAKFRTSAFNNEVEWCKDYQLKRYVEINKEAPVFAVLGVGGAAANPERIYIVPVKQAKYTKLFVSLLRKYEFNPRQPVNPHQLWRML